MYYTHLFIVFSCYSMFKIFLVFLLSKKLEHRVLSKFSFVYIHLVFCFQFISFYLCQSIFAMFFKIMYVMIQIGSFHESSFFPLPQERKPGSRGDKQVFSFGLWFHEAKRSYSRPVFFQLGEEFSFRQFIARIKGKPLSVWI
jgi:hypothetical protein